MCVTDENLEFSKSDKIYHVYSSSALFSLRLILQGLRHVCHHQNRFPYVSYVILIIVKKIERQWKCITIWLEVDRRLPSSLPNAHLLHCTRARCSFFKIVLPAIDFCIPVTVPISIQQCRQQSASQSHEVRPKSKRLDNHFAGYGADRGMPLL